MNQRSRADLVRPAQEAVDCDDVGDRRQQDHDVDLFERVHLVASRGGRALKMGELAAGRTLGGSAPPRGRQAGCDWLWVIHRSPKSRSAADSAAAPVRTEFQNVQRGT
jgi:hypothetical protein